MEGGTALVATLTVAAAGWVAWATGPMVRRLVRMTWATVPPGKKDKDALRIGILGAANIAPPALVWPAGKMKDVIVVAIAARDEERAKAFAKKHGIPRVHTSYEALISDPDIDAIYNPLPNGLHLRWTLKALEAGKHVLCEKPIASNAEEAKQLQTASKKSGKVLMEAFHYRFHPVARRMREIVASGELGRVQRIETEGLLPFMFASDDDIRLNCRGSESRLAGGALMDIGCYAVNCLRYLAGGPPTAVTSAVAREAFPGVDGEMEAKLDFPNGVKAKVKASLRMMPFKEMTIFAARALVVGDKATMKVNNFIAPFAYHWIEVTQASGASRTEKLYGDGETTYECQLKAFVALVRGELKGERAGSAEDAVENMEVIDQIYKKSGLGRRVGFV